MYFHIVIKHIRCLPCDHLIDVRKFRTAQDATTPEAKAFQEKRIGHEINRKASVLGFHICPKCYHRASITDPPIVFWGNDGNLLRDAQGNPVSRYADQVDMQLVKWDQYGHAHYGGEL